jgi:hypothetical protein
MCCHFLLKFLFKQKRRKKGTIASCCCLLHSKTSNKTTKKNEEKGGSLPSSSPFCPLASSSCFYPFTSSSHFWLPLLASHFKRLFLAPISSFKFQAFSSVGNGMNVKWREVGRRGKLWGIEESWKNLGQGKRMCFWFIPKMSWMASS